MNKYCPDCVVKLLPQTKKLGYVNKWFTCPKCGFRVRPNDPDSELEEMKVFEEHKKIVNKNNQELQ